MKRIFIIAALCVIVCNAFAEELYTVCLPVPVSVYENAITDAKIIGSLAPKQEVEVYVVNGDWAIIKYNGGVGYVAAACLKKAETKPVETNQSAQQIAQPSTQEPQQTVAEQPSVQQPVQETPTTQKEQPKPTVVKEESKPTAETNTGSTKTTKNLALPQTDIYESYDTYTLISKKNRVADILECKGNMYITFDYLLDTRTDGYLMPYHNSGQNKINMHLGQFNFGCIAKLWGPIGLDFGFGLGVGGNKYDMPAPPSSENDWTVFDKTIRFKLDYNLYLRPVFWVNVTDDISLHLVTGPRFDIIFLESDYSSVDGDRKFAGDVDYNSLNKNDPYRLVSIPWALGLGFTYNHIGFRIMYEWELYGGYRNKYAALHPEFDRNTMDAHHNCLTASIFIPILYF